MLLRKCRFAAEQSPDGMHFVATTRLALEKPPRFEQDQIDRRTQNTEFAKPKASCDLVSNIEIKGITMLRIILFAVSFAIATPAAAQSVLDCSGWQASARNIPEPLQNHTRTFANGDIRVTLLDTVEPAAGAFYLMVIAPPYDEMGSRNCAIIASSGGTMGFGGLFFANIGASYDPANGLTLRLPAQVFAPATGGFDPAILAVTINQSAGTIIPRFEIP